MEVVERKGRDGQVRARERDEWEEATGSGLRGKEGRSEGLEVPVTCH